MRLSLCRSTWDRRPDSPADRAFSELYDGPPSDLTMCQGVTRLVDLVQRVAACHQPVQWQSALPKPADEHGEIPVRPTGPARRASEDLPHEQIPRVDRRRGTMGHTDQHRHTPILQAVHPGPRRRQHLLRGLAEADGIEHHICPAFGDLDDACHRILSGPINAQTGTKCLRERNFLVGEVDDDNRVGAHVVCRLENA